MLKYVFVSRKRDIISPNADHYRELPHTHTHTPWINKPQILPATIYPSAHKHAIKMYRD
jgi:hypothetical protein